MAVSRLSLQTIVSLGRELERLLDRPPVAGTHDWLRMGRASIGLRETLDTAIEDADRDERVLAHVLVTMRGSLLTLTDNQVLRIDSLQTLATSNAVQRIQRARPDDFTSALENLREGLGHVDRQLEPIDLQESVQRQQEDGPQVAERESRGSGGSEEGAENGARAGLEQQAIEYFVQRATERQAVSMTEIARHVGVHRTTPYRWTRFRAIKDEFDALTELEREERRRGFQTVDERGHVQVEAIHLDEERDLDD